MTIVIFIFQCILMYSISGFADDRLGDVTLLILVHDENILYDAACGLLISPRNEGIRYSGGEKTRKKGVKIYVTKWITMTLFAGRLRPIR